MSFSKWFKPGFKPSRADPGMGPYPAKAGDSLLRANNNLYRSFNPDLMAYDL